MVECSIAAWSRAGSGGRAAVGTAPDLAARAASDLLGVRARSRSVEASASRSSWLRSTRSKMLMGCMVVVSVERSGWAWPGPGGHRGGSSEPPPKRCGHALFVPLDASRLPSAQGYGRGGRRGCGIQVRREWWRPGLLVASMVASTLLSLAIKDLGGLVPVRAHDRDGDAAPRRRLP